MKFSRSKASSRTAAAVAAVLVGLVMPGAGQAADANAGLSDEWADEVEIAIAVNTTGMIVQSQVADARGNPLAGGAIRLTEAQMCAIFSGLVTDWNATMMINAVNETGGVIRQSFDNVNVGDGGSTPVPYSRTSLPIMLVYHSDDNGVSFAITDYLKQICPSRDPSDSLGYATIFNRPNLPSMTFQRLKDNIDMSGLPGHSTAHWVAATGSNNVAVTVAQSGAGGSIGYLNYDFTQPSALHVAGIAAGAVDPVTVDAPFSARLQNEAQKVARSVLPITYRVPVANFIAPRLLPIFSAWRPVSMPDTVNK